VSVYIKGYFSFLLEGHNSKTWYNTLLGMEAAPNNKSKISCSINNGLAGYLMTS